MVGNALAEASRPVASSQRWSTPCSVIRAAIARETTSRGASSSTKRSPSRVAQEGAVPAERLGQERAGHRRVVQGGRVELDELDVGDGDAGAQCHRHPVAGRLGGVGGHGEELAGAAGGEDDVVGPDGDGRAGRRRGRAAR